ncbi:hypothetical protein EIP75_17705 [Aquabacterium soli]|jgi:hypothetical protein|uniref:Uncharacterized protein n=1 Tax=Aquabacterium soli TaxID=2493092 RepID=A0A3R8T3A4_9BURK|nr:hypothetical protein [Aquabacterium soli]RRS02979.1 hypothetical protein EIP75_17705 [Aquabacterium soli]
MNLKDLSPSGCLDTADSQRCDATLPDNPQCTLNVHFGMMLGVDELRTEQGFHIGRSRRHQRLLHGTGVVAGYPLAFDDETFDLQVGPGLAIDALGRDLALEAGQCVNLVQWWLRHQQDEAFDDLASLEDATIDLDVRVCYSTCLSSPVPAIAEPCAGNASDIAYSRVCETVSLLLRRRVPPVDAPTPAPADPNVPDAIPPAEVPSITEAAKTHAGLALLLSQIDTTPPDPIDTADLCLTLATLRGVHLKKDADGWTATLDAIDLGTRPLLLSTGVLQQLLLPLLA